MTCLFSLLVSGVAHRSFPLEPQCFSHPRRPRGSWQRLWKVWRTDGSSCIALQRGGGKIAWRAQTASEKLLETDWVFPPPLTALGSPRMYFSREGVGVLSNSYLVLFIFSASDVRSSAAQLLETDPFVNFTQEELSQLAWLFTWCSGANRWQLTWRWYCDKASEEKHWSQCTKTL